MVRRRRKPPSTLPGKEVIRLMCEAGAKDGGQDGTSHRRILVPMTNESWRSVPVPNTRHDLPPGTFRSIRKSMGSFEKDFWKAYWGDQKEHVETPKPLATGKESPATDE